MGEFNVNQLVLLVYIHLAIWLSPGLIYLAIDEYRERREKRIKRLKMRHLPIKTPQETSKAA